MNKITVGFIGAGNMGSALMAGMAGNAKLLAYDISPKACQRAKENYQVRILPGIKELVAESQVIFVAVKPQFLEKTLPEIKTGWTSDKVLASIVAGKSIAYWQGVLGEDAQIARIMPNTPAMVKEAMNTVCFSAATKKPDVIVKLLSYTGRVMEIRENIMDAAMGVAGCGPAFVYMFIEALADAGVAGGLFRQQAYELAAQTVLGAAKMVLETGQHPAALKDAVCSPGGVTIQGVMALEQYGFRSSIQQAVSSAMRGARP